MVVLNIHDASEPSLIGRLEIKLVKLLGVGSYGRVYLTNLNNMVIKIFDNDENLTKINMEYKIFKKLIDYSLPIDKAVVASDLRSSRISTSGDLGSSSRIPSSGDLSRMGSSRDSTSSNSHTYPINLVKALGRGELIEDFYFEGSSHLKGSRFILLPLYKKFYEFHKIPQRLQKFEFIIDFITILLKVCVFLEKELKIVNMDIKTSNLMYDGKELILIDLGLVQEIDNGKEIYIHDKKYFVWPYDSCFLVAIPVYSIAICVLEFFFGKLKVWKIYSIDDVKNLLNDINKRSEKIGHILGKMISLKYDPITVLKYIEIKYRSAISITDKELKIPNKRLESGKKKSKKKHNSTVNKWYSNLLSSVHSQENI